MKIGKLSFIVVACALASLFGAASLMLVPGCGSQSDVGEQQVPADTSQVAPKIAGAPTNALLGQRYYSKTDKREYIYDGVRWVPHDATIDDAIWQTTYQAAARATALKTAFFEPPCSGTGAHAKHDAFITPNNCKICHMVGGVVCFDPAGPAVASGQPAPSFDSTAKTCSNISCHGMYSGTYSYWRWLGEDNWELITVNYAGNGGTTPAWNTTVGGCSACHGNPPQTGTWHSPYHGGGSNCQLCHPDATGSGGVGTAITNPSLHANGTVNVQAQWTSSCWGCH